MIIPWVMTLTESNVVVLFSDYEPGQLVVRTGADLQASLEWYAALAIAVNWVLYVWGAKRIIDARQRKREARATVQN